jgi:general L-amino acid transport system substrate-binding protein
MTKTPWLKRLAIAAAIAVPAMAPLTASAGPTLDAIKSKGMLRCGVNTGLLGFSAPDSQWV